MRTFRFIRRFRNGHQTNRSTNNTAQTAILPRVAVDEDKDETEYANIKILGKSKQIKLVTLRMILVMLNLIVLAASFISYLAWMDAKYNWKMVNTADPNRNILAAIEYLPIISPSAQKIISSVHGHLDQLLYLTAFNLFLYWLVYGFVISCRFGGTCDICTIVVSLPHTVIMVVWEIGIASAVMRVNTIFCSLPWDNIVTHYSQHYTDLRYVHDFYSKWGPLIVTSYFLSVPVQILVICLPFLMSSFPFQKEFYPMSEEVTLPNARLNQPIQEPDCQAQPEHSVSFRNNTEHTRQQNIPEYIQNTGGQCTLLPPAPRRQFVTLEERPIMQLQQMNATNRTVERNTTYCPTQIKYGQRMVSAGKAVIETMNRAYHVHNSDRPLWNLLERPAIPHPRLEARDCLAGGVRIFNPANYLNMAYSSPPPPYSLHPQLESHHQQAQQVQHQPPCRQPCSKGKADLDTSSYVDADPYLDYQDIELAAAEHPTTLHHDQHLHHSNMQLQDQLDHSQEDEHYYKDYQEWSERSLII